MMNENNDDSKHGARKGSCHTVAKSLLKRANVTTHPVKISALVGIISADYPGIKFHNTDKLPSSVYALTYRQQDRIDIAFNNTVSTNRQKFSVAHELGHLYMGHVHGGGAIDFESGEQAEKEANEFAAELIMPSVHLRKFIIKNNRSMPEIVKAFEVSEEALWWRIMDTGLWKHLKS